MFAVKASAGDEVIREGDVRWPLSIPRLLGCSPAPPCLQLWCPALLVITQSLHDRDPRLQVGDNFYVAGSGRYQVHLKARGAEPVHQYSAGCSFGELALLHNSPRAATVVCAEGCVLWVLDRSTFRHIMISANKKVVDSSAQFLTSVSVLQARNGT